MSEITCRCYYCYRVHTVSAGTVGYVLTCSCGRNFRVPPSAAGPDASPEEIPLAERVDPLGTGVDEPRAVAPEAAVLAPEPGSGDDRESAAHDPAAGAPATVEESADEEAVEVVSLHEVRDRVVVPPVLPWPWPDPEEEEAEGGAEAESDHEVAPAVESGSEEAAAEEAPLPAGIDASPDADEVEEPAAPAPSPVEPVSSGLAAAAALDEPPAAEAATVPEVTGESVSLADPAIAAAAPSQSTQGKRQSMGKGYLVLAILAFGLWLVHTSPWIYLTDADPLPEVMNLVDHTHYLGLERAFWSALLAGLTICFFGEAIFRRRAARDPLDSAV